MRYICVGDIHFSDRPPASCTDSYLDDLFDILEHTVDLEASLGAEGVVWAGDVFHHKTPSRTSHRTVQRVIELVHSYKRLWIVPGNHDMLHDRFDSLRDTQPLGVLFQAGAELLSGWEASGEHPLYGVPWQQRWDPEVLDDVFHAWRESNRGARVGFDPAQSLVVTHAPLYPPSLELPYEYYPLRDEETALGESDYVDGRPGWSTLMGNKGYCYYGHVHEAHGIYQVDGVTYCNQGAISRGSLHEANLTRQIAVTSWSPEEGFERLEVPHRPADEVFRLVERREEQSAQVSLDSFLESIGHTQLEVTSIEAVTAQVRGMNLDPEVVRVVEELLAEAQAGHAS